MANEGMIWFEHRRLQWRPTAPSLPGAGEIRYRVDAFALNRSELLFMNDDHYVPRRDGVRLGYEACGVVDAVGEGVNAFKVGDRVTSIPFASDAYGVNGTWAITPAEWLVPWPAELSAAEACSVWMQYLTAYFPLFELAPIQPGQAVLISAASSSAAIGACQLAKARGARTIGLTRTSAKAAALRALGYDVVIASDEEADLAGAVTRAAAGSPVKLSYDAVCGRLIARYISALAKGATVFAYGTLSGESEIRLPMTPAVRGDITVRAYSTPNFSHDPGHRRRAILLLQSLLASGELRPIVDRIFPLHAWQDAYARLRSGNQIGKIVVAIKQEA